jgi:putative hydrolase of the HAD superfamily
MALAAVTLDAGGTLFAVAEPVGVTYARVAGRHGISLDPRALERGFHEAFAGAPPLAFPGASPTRLAEHERAWWYTVVRRAFGEAATARDFDACFGELFAYYARPEAWRVFPEVRDVLGELRQAGMRLAVVSNFDRRLLGLLAGLELAPLVHHTVCSAGVGAAKPDPRIFRVALARLGAAPRGTLHVGDSVGRDIEGARAAGLHAVLLDRDGRRPALPPDVPSVTTLVELPALVAAVA